MNVQAFTWLRNKGDFGMSPSRWELVTSKRAQELSKNEEKIGDKVFLVYNKLKINTLFSIGTMQKVKKYWYTT